MPLGTVHILRNQNIGNFKPLHPSVIIRNHGRTPSLLSTILRNHGLTPLAKLQNFLEFQSFVMDINLDGGRKNKVFMY